MGYIRNHGILVTAMNRESGEAAHAKAMELFASRAPLAAGFLSDLSGCVTPLQESPCERRYSFAILPDCSKEGWPESDYGDSMRTAFKAWLRTTCYEDGSGDIAWAEVQYGDEEGITYVTDSDSQQKPTVLVGL